MKPTGWWRDIRSKSTRNSRSEYPLSAAVWLTKNFPLELSPSFHGLQHGDLVGVLNVAAHRDSHRDARHLQPLPAELSREIGRRGFALHRGIGGQNHFIHLPAIHSPHQVGDS